MLIQAMANAAVAILIAATTATAADAVQLSRSAVLEQARHRAPELLAELERAGLAAGALHQAGLWPYNPELGLMGGPRIGDDDTSWDYGIALSQRLPLSGRRSAAIALARANLDTTRASIAERSRAVLLEAALRHLDAVRAQEHVVLSQAAVDLADRIGTVIERRRAAGDADDLDANVATIALARSRAALRRAAAEAAASRAQLAALLGIPPKTPVTILGSLQWESPGKSQAQDAVARRPELARLLAERRSAEAAEQVAAVRAGIDPTLSLSYEREEDQDIVHFGLGLELPLANRGQGDRAAARASARLASRRHEAERQRIVGEIAAAIERAQALNAAAADFREAILPRLKTNERLTDLAFRSGSLSFSEVLSQQREVLAARAELLALDYQAATAAAEATAAAALPPFTTDLESATPQPKDHP
ncbi:MAG: TolC family protein [Planctomycetota bacterium]|jgi:cobalt-zinc-cadmium efflux system outer membrane protein|nr:TolC family protein [Planctomycetota bacterium]